MTAPCREALELARDRAARAYFDEAHPPGRIAPVTPRIQELRADLRTAEAALAAWTPPAQPWIYRAFERVRRTFRGA